MLALLFALQSLAYYFIFKYFYRRASRKRIYVVSLMFKVFIGLCVGMLYSLYYQEGDMLAYYDDAVFLTDLCLQNPYKYSLFLFDQELVEGLRFADQSRALFFSKIASVVSLFSLKNYWLITLSFSLINFFFSWWFVVKLIDFLKGNEAIVYVSILFYPSVVFWSSGLLKEAIALSLIYFLSGALLSYHKKRYGWKKNTFFSLAVVLFSWALWMLKYYYAAILLPILLVLFIIQNMKHYQANLTHIQWKLTWLMLILIASGLFLIFMFSHPNLNPDAILKAIVKNHDLSVTASDEGKYIIFEGLSPNFTSFLAQFPKAVYSGLFRPLPFEGSGLLFWLAGIENFVLLSLSILALISLFSLKKISNPEMVVACIIYVILLAGLISLASPNFGSLSRYKVAYAPFWLLISLLCINESPFFSSISQSKKKI
ncbi:hypothetical protein WJR50_23350 [Catalinimonas sp. 4WD22]|uniref:hypothetical protein n=1 Tax=Catalinimonas locisalis TaxID=3133978 RepID=UPI003100ED5A